MSLPKSSVGQETVIYERVIQVVDDGHLSAESTGGLISTCLLPSLWGRLILNFLVFCCTFLEKVRYFFLVLKLFKPTRGKNYHSFLGMASVVNWAEFGTLF